MKSVICNGFLGAALIASAAILITGCESNKGPTQPSGQYWLFEQVASGNQVGIHSSLTTTSDGTVHIAYHDADQKGLFYVRRTGQDQWVHTRLDSAGWLGRSVTIQSDPGDTLHVAYQDFYHLDLLYARYDGSTWEYDRLPLSTSYGKTPVMLVRPDGLHLLEKSDKNYIYYWHGSLANWTLAKRIRFVSMVESYDFAYGPNGPAVVSMEERYTSYGSQRIYSYNVVVKKSTSPTGLWESTTVASGLKDCLNIPLAVGFDEQGLLHVLYRSSDMVLHDAGWGVIDSEIGEGLIRIQKGKGSNSGLWVLYPMDSGLALGYYSGPQGWRRVSRISDLSTEGRYDLHIASDGTVHICAYNRSQEQLIYGRWGGTP